MLEVKACPPKVHPLCTIINMDHEIQNQEAERFSNGVANLLMATEELRQTLSSSSVTIHLLVQWQHELESLLQQLGDFHCVDSLLRFDFL